MKKQEHIELLRQGADKWNAWRAEHQNGGIDLSRADLHGANLIVSSSCYCFFDLQAETSLLFRLFKTAIMDEL